MKKHLKKVDFSKMPVSGSLGHLAYGDLAFTAWRKIKVSIPNASLDLLKSRKIKVDKNLTKHNEEK